MFKSRFGEFWSHINEKTGEPRKCEKTVLNLSDET